MKPINEVTPAELAREFSRLLREQLTAQEVEQAQKLNAIEATSNPDYECCHSHDFCDANMVMDEAVKNLTGVSACDTEPKGEQAPCMSDEWVVGYIENEN